MYTYTYTHIYVLSRALGKISMCENVFYPTSAYIYIYIYIVVFPKREKRKYFKVNWSIIRFGFFLKNCLFPSYVCVCFQLVAYVRQHVASTRVSSSLIGCPISITLYVL